MKKVTEIFETNKDELGAVKADLVALKSDISALTKSVASSAQENASAFGETAKVKMKTAADKTKAVSLQSKEKAQETIKANPLKSIAATAGIGLIIGALMNRKKK